MYNLDALLFLFKLQKAFSNKPALDVEEQELMCARLLRSRRRKKQREKDALFLKEQTELVNEYLVKLGITPGFTHRIN